MKKLFDWMFGGYRLVSKNDLNQLWSSVSASKVRLIGLHVSPEHLKNYVEKAEILTMLNDTEKTLEKYLD